MFNSLEKAMEIVLFIKDYIGDGDRYSIDMKELLFICEDYIDAHRSCDAMSYEIESLRNYIRLLEKENKELKEKP